MMTLTTEQMRIILSGELDGSEPRIRGKEADQFRKDLQPDLELAEKMGWVIDIPSEW